MCEEWLNSSTLFCLWADSNGYAPGLTIDRVDVDLGYSPKNCRWVSKLDQRENKYMQHNNTSGYVGVSYLKTRKKYEAYYTHNGKNIIVGTTTQL